MRRAGAEPYLMTEAAEHLEKLAGGTLPRNPLLPILQALAPGPAVGPGGAGREPALLLLHEHYFGSGQGSFA